MRWIYSYKISVAKTDILEDKPEEQLNSFRVLQSTLHSCFSEYRRPLACPLPAGRKLIHKWLISFCSEVKADIKVLAAKTPPQS